MGFFLISNSSWDSLYYWDSDFHLFIRRLLSSAYKCSSWEFLQRNKCWHNTQLNTKFLAAPNIPIQLLLHLSTIPVLQCLENLGYYEILSLSLLREEDCRETLQFSFRENSKEKNMPKQSRLKYSRKLFVFCEWMWCQEGDLAVMDGSCFLHSLHVRFCAPWKGCTWEQGGMMPVPCSWWWLSGLRGEDWNIPSEQANLSHARAEVWLCRAGVRSTGVAAGQWHQICPSPEEQWQTHSHASGTMEQGWRYLGLCVERIFPLKLHSR